MKDELIKNIINKIEEYDTIAIYRHVFPDPDSYSSQTALKSIIENLSCNIGIMLAEKSGKIQKTETNKQTLQIDGKEVSLLDFEKVNIKRENCNTLI